MADGLMIYRDFLSPQPPMHLLTGSALVRLGRFLEAHCGLEDGPLMTVRVFSMVLHLLTMLCIWGLGRQITGSREGGLLAAALYLLLPLNFWWSLGYQSELLEIFWMFSALTCFVRFRPIPMAGAGVLMGLAVLTNMTAAPYAVANLVFLTVRHGWGLAARGGAGGNWWGAISCRPAGDGERGDLLRGTNGRLFSQCGVESGGILPEGRFWEYAVGKVLSQGGKILVNEGGFIVMGLLGLMAYNRRERRVEREYVVWYALALLFSLLYVTKGGTMDYSSHWANRSWRCLEHTF
jgi:4-amino-4-deoxy-L-arabinose transferase-like glycosyltransferase